MDAQDWKERGFRYWGGSTEKDGTPWRRIRMCRITCQPPVRSDLMVVRRESRD